MAEFRKLFFEKIRRGKEKIGGGGGGGGERGLKFRHTQIN